MANERYAAAGLRLLYNPLVTPILLTAVNVNNRQPQDVPLTGLGFSNYHAVELSARVQTVTGADTVLHIYGKNLSEETGHHLVFPDNAVTTQRFRVSVGSTKVLTVDLSRACKVLELRLLGVWS